MKTRELNKYLPILFLLISLLFALVYDLRYSLNIPIADQWTMIKHLDHLDIKYLWANHNEHIILFPKIIFFFLAKLTHWNIYAEIILGWVLFSALMLFLYYSLLSKEISSNITNRSMLIAGSLLIFCAPIHYQNWLWGWQIQILLSVLSSVIGVYLISNIGGNVKVESLGILGTMLSMIVAGYSFFSGLIAAFIIVLIGLYMFRCKKITILSTFILIASLLAILLSYYFNIPRAGQLSVNPADCVRIILFIPTYLGVIFSVARTGGPLILTRAAEIAAFIMGISLLSYSVIIMLNIKTIMAKYAKNTRLIYPAGLAAFSLLIGLSLALSRGNYGISAALTSRYRLFSMLFVIGTAYFAAYSKTLNNIFKYKYARTTIIVVFAVIYLFNWTMGIEIGKKWVEKYEILTNIGSNNIDRIPSDYVGGISKEEIMNDLIFLKTNKLALYRHKT